MTPYSAAKFVNSSLKDAGLDVSIPPQMMYNYTSARLNAGKVPFIKYTKESGVDENDLKEWTKKYIAKKIANLTTSK